jgi:4-amino-4-deoxy-L-arabinose transferase-like glycosyltransferase
MAGRKRSEWALLLVAEARLLKIRDMLIGRFPGFQFAALGIILLTVAIRFPSLQHPQAIDDEAAYSVVANEIVDGGRPYIDAVDRKPPLLFWTYAAVFAIAGKYNWVALHAAALLWTLGTMAGLYVIGRRLFDRETGLIAALFYSVFQPWAVANNLAFNGEMLMNLPLVWAWAIRAFRGRRAPLHWVPSQTTGGDCSRAARIVSAPPKLSR